MTIRPSNASWILLITGFIGVVPTLAAFTRSPPGTLPAPGGTGGDGLGRRDEAATARGPVEREVSPIRSEVLADVGPTRNAPSMAQSAAPKPNEPLDDGAILGVLDVASSAEVEEGSLAITKAHRSRVKNLAKKLVTEDSERQKRGKALADQTGLKLEPSPTAANVTEKSDQIVMELVKASPLAFDRDYVAAQVSMHEDLLNIIDEALLPQAHASDVAAFVHAARSHVARHLGVARELLRDLEPKAR